MTSQLPPTIYVNNSTLNKCVGKTVRIIGRVIGVAPGRVQLESSDGRTVTIIRPRDSQPFNSRYVCITGTVQNDYSISEGTFEEFGDNFVLMHDSMNKVEFYFDFISPYSYIAFLFLRGLKLSWNLRLDLKPIRLPYTIKASGNHPPANVPAKGKFVAKDLMRTSRAHGIPLKFPKDFLAAPSKPAELIVMAARELCPEKVEELVDTIWREFFGRGDSSKFTTDPISLLPILPVEYGDQLVEMAKQANLESKLNGFTDEALEEGAFGVPTMTITNSKGERDFFFGSDRFHHIAEFIGHDHRLLAQLQLIHSKI